jgi:16S rRNA (adenine1518-N6/adenine1519-N6)-dimethyltransferase
MKASEVRTKLREAGVRPSKRMGQHFLLEEDLAHRMVEYAGIRPGEVVLEVGPGLGTLTDALLRRAERLVAVEKDPRLCDYLRRRFPELELLQADVLHIKLPPFDRVVSNLPYEISSPFTFKLLKASFKRAVITYQREFAERLVAQPGTKAYSRLSVKVRYRCRARMLELVSPSAFWPQPEVESAIVQLDSIPPPFEVDPERYGLVVDALFAHRRKTAMNALLHSWRDLASSKEGLRVLLRETPLASKRADEMTPVEMAELTNLLVPPKG